MSFVMQQECETAALCNSTVGMCTAATCVPEAFSCDNNTLKVCNADGTGFDEARSMPCGSGTCDAKGMDCNMCEPGMEMCMGDSVAVCDETGQTFQETPCGSGMRCVGAGNCVECSESGDCEDLTEGCKVGMCSRNACAAVNAPNSTQCTASGGRPGRCSSGSCMCEPQCQGKRCGDNGCDGNCGTCSGGTKCSPDFECVECTASSDCTSTNPCSRGTCSGGNCRFDELSGTRCEGTGTCRSGSCCQPDCRRKCGGDDDGCGGTCRNPCSTGQTCDEGACSSPPTQTVQACTTSDTCPGGGIGPDAQGCISGLGYCSIYCASSSACSSGRLCIGAGVCAYVPPCASNLVPGVLGGDEVCRSL
jgi:hypothetical protein